jgi:hypothetical protein
MLVEDALSFYGAIFDFALRGQHKDETGRTTMEAAAYRVLIAAAARGEVDVLHGARKSCASFMRYTLGQH